MKAKDYYFRFVVFYTELQENGNYKVKLDPTEDWVLKVKAELETESRKVVFIVVDQFMNYVYDLPLLSRQEKDYFRKNLYMKIKKLSLVLFESELIEDIFGTKNFSKLISELSDSYRFSKTEIQNEVKRRKEIYNPKCISLTEDWLTDISKRAIVFFVFEKVLMEKLSKSKQKSITQRR